MWPGHVACCGGEPSLASVLLGWAWHLSEVLFTPKAVWLALFNAVCHKPSPKLAGCWCCTPSSRQHIGTPPCLHLY